MAYPLSDVYRIYDVTFLLYLYNSRYYIGYIHYNLIFRMSLGYILNISRIYPRYDKTPPRYDKTGGVSNKHILPVYVGKSPTRLTICQLGSILKGGVR